MVSQTLEFLRCAIQHECSVLGYNVHYVFDL